MMTEPLTIRSLALLATFAAGVALACHSKTIDNANHCYNADGDRTCAARFGDERRFCVGPGDGCDAADEFDGCVAEPPAEACYSPCRLGSFAGEDGSCLAAADESESEDGSESESEGETGMEPVCGDGELDNEEECDDGNDIDDDDCTNACTLPVCGDGIVQAHLGEACDDGNTASGDGCTATCELPGAIIWSRTYDFGGCPPFGLGLRSDGSPAIVVQCATPPGRLITFDGDGEIDWNQVVMAVPFALAIGPQDEFAVVGIDAGFQGSLTTLGSGGALEWSLSLPNAMYPASVTIDGAGKMVVGGGTVSGDRFLIGYMTNGGQSWFHTEGGGAFLALASSEDGHLWALRSVSPRIETYTVTGKPEWVTGPLGAPVPQLGLAIDPKDNNYHAYAVTQIAAEPQGFRVDKFDSKGVALWSALHDEIGVEEQGLAVAVLPMGGALVAGYTNGIDAGDEKNGLLSWYSSDGIHLQDVVYDGDELRAVAVSAEGEYAIAMGTTPAGSAVWLIKVQL